MLTQQQPTPTNKVWIDPDPRNVEATSQTIVDQHRQMLRALRIAANGGVGAGATPVKAPKPNRGGEDDEDDEDEDNYETAANPFLAQIPTALRPATVVPGKYGFVDESQYAERNEVKKREAADTVSRLLSVCVCLCAPVSSSCFSRTAVASWLFLTLE